MGGSVLVPNKSQAVTDNTFEVSIKGKWVRVPAVELCGDIIIVQGKWVKMAAVNDEEWLDHELENPGLYVERLKEDLARGFRADIFTFSQKPPLTVPKYSYYMEQDSIAAIELKSFAEWWEELPQEGRKNVRRAQKRGVAISVRGLDDDLVRGIVELNNDSPIRQGRPYAHYGKSFDQVKKDHSAFLDRSDFICAHFADELIGFLKIVYRGDIASILQLTPRARHHDKRPANALLSKAVELCSEKGMQCITYGKYFYGTRRHSPLLEFKMRNGFEELLIPRYYVPLTNWGRLAKAMNLHRGILGVLPQGVTNMGVRLREKWYSGKC